MGAGCVKTLFLVKYAYPSYQGGHMKRFILGISRDQGTLFPEYLEDFVTEDNPVRVVDVFVE